MDFLQKYRPAASGIRRFLARSGNYRYAKLSFRQTQAIKNPEVTFRVS